MEVKVGLWYEFFMKVLILFPLLTFCCSVQASDIFCEAWYQANSASLEKVKMGVQRATTVNTVFLASQHGYDYKVDWNYELTTFNVAISFGDSIILTTTARVPTLNHPENFTDLNIPNGPRLSVNCEMK